MIVKGYCGVLEGVRGDDGDGERKESKALGSWAQLWWRHRDNDTERTPDSTLTTPTRRSLLGAGFGM